MDEHHRTYQNITSYIRASQNITEHTTTSRNMSGQHRTYQNIAPSYIYRTSHKLPEHYRIYHCYPSAAYHRDSQDIIEHHGPAQSIQKHKCHTDAEHHRIYQNATQPYRYRTSKNLVEHNNAIQIQNITLYIRTSQNIIEYHIPLNSLNQGKELWHRISFIEAHLCKQLLYTGDAELNTMSFRGSWGRNTACPLSLSECCCSLDRPSVWPPTNATCTRRVQRSLEEGCWVSSSIRSNGIQYGWIPIDERQYISE